MKKDNVMNKSIMFLLIGTILVTLSFSFLIPSVAMAGNWKKSAYYSVLSNLNGAKTGRYGMLALNYFDNDQDSKGMSALYSAYQYAIKSRNNALTARNYANNAYLANPTARTYNARQFAIAAYNYKSSLVSNLLNNYNYGTQVLSSINNCYLGDSKNGWAIFYGALFSNGGSD